VHSDYYCGYDCAHEAATVDVAAAAEGNKMLESPCIYHNDFLPAENHDHKQHCEIHYKTICEKMQQNTTKPHHSVEEIRRLFIKQNVGKSKKMHQNTTKL
jgi:hypothetical protein